MEAEGRTKAADAARRVAEWMRAQEQETHKRPRLRPKLTPLVLSSFEPRLSLEAMTAPPETNFDLWDRSEIYELEGFARQFERAEAVVAARGGPAAEAFRANRANCGKACECYWSDFAPCWTSVKGAGVPLKRATREGAAVYTKGSFLADNLGHDAAAARRLEAVVQAGLEADGLPVFPDAAELRRRVRLSVEANRPIALPPPEADEAAAALGLRGPKRALLRPWPPPEDFDPRRADHHLEALPSDYAPAWKRPRPDTPFAPGALEGGTDEPREEPEK
jgi:hypothetical protein